jgi:hypothetical protein
MKARAATIAIFALLAVLAFSWQGWGLPESWPSDEITGVVQGMVERRSLDPRHFLYPSFMVDTCYLVARVVGARDMAGLGHVCRSVSALFFLLSVFCMGRAVELVLGERRPFAYFFSGTIGALLHHAHLATVNSCFFFTINLALFQFVRTLRSARERDFYLSVLACSLATGAKYNGCFLFGVLPLLWLLAFGGEVRSKRFLRALLVSVLIAPLPFLLVTPYCLLDPGKFRADWIALTQVEGPAFRAENQGVTPFGFLKVFADFSLGYFSPGTAALVALWGLAAYGFWLGRPRALLEEKPLLAKSALVLALSFVLYLGMTWQIGIFQRRYFLPAALMLALLFLLGLYATEKPRLRALTLVLLSVFNGANAWANVAAFPLSSKSQALSVLEPLEGTIGVVALPGHFPFQRGPLDERTSVFTLEESPEGVETFDEYLSVVERFFREKKPRWLVFEGAVTEWTAFLPRKEGGDRGKRFLYPNPGLVAWNAHLERAGYSRWRVLENGEGPLALPWPLGCDRLVTREGIGRPVYVYERRPS